VHDRLLGTALAGVTYEAAFSRGPPHAADTKARNLLDRHSHRIGGKAIHTKHDGHDATSPQGGTQDEVHLIQTGEVGLCARVLHVGGRTADRRQNCG
jgi:hypothetical protein